MPGREGRSTNERRPVLPALALLHERHHIICHGQRQAPGHTGRKAVPEARLFLLALLGGGIGGLLGMYAFRHKTRHLHFVIGFPLIAAVQILAALYLLRMGG